jgi:hypothetical protein
MSKIDFKYKNQDLKFAIKVTNENGEELFFNDLGKRNKDDHVEILEILLEQLKGNKNA